MYVGCARCGGRCGLGDATADQAASAAGNIIGGITGIPGLGQVAGFVASLFGPSPHFTPSGVPYDTQAKTIKTLIQQVATLTNQLHAREGLPPIPVPAFSFTSSDDALLAKWMGALLNDPTVAAATTEDDVIADQAHGIMDEAVTAAQSLISSLNEELAAPATTPVADVLATTDPASLVTGNDYQSVTGAPPGEIPGSYNSVQQGATAPASSAPAPMLAGLNIPMLALAALAAIVLIKVV